MQIVLNALTLSRAPLALLFMLDSPLVRILAVALAMITDSIDGWLARRWRSTSRFGAILDPLMDKFFVYFVLSVLFMESRIELWEALAMVSRDFSLVVFASYLIITRQLRVSEFRAIIWGKVSTALQFGVLIAIVIGYQIPAAVFYLFMSLSVLALIELFWLQAKKLKA